MRISVDERDPGYRTYCEWGGRLSGAKVFLNGVEMQRCVTADEELGEVLIFSTGERASLSAARFGGWPTEWLRGEVKIVMPECETD